MTYAWEMIHRVMNLGNTDENPIAGVSNHLVCDKDHP